LSSSAARDRTLVGKLGGAALGGFAFVIGLFAFLFVAGANLYFAYNMSAQSANFTGIALSCGVPSFEFGIAAGVGLSFDGRHPSAMDRLRKTGLILLGFAALDLILLVTPVLGPVF